MSTVTVKTAAWYGDRDVDLTFPEDWNVETAAFESRPVLTDEQLADVFANPVGTSESAVPPPTGRRRSAAGAKSSSPAAAVIARTAPPIPRSGTNWARGSPRPVRR